MLGGVVERFDPVFGVKGQDGVHDIVEDRGDLFFTLANLMGQFQRPRPAPGLGDGEGQEKDQDQRQSVDHQKPGRPERGKGFVLVHLRGQGEAQFRIPQPDTDHGNTTVIPVAFHLGSGFAVQGAGRHPGQGVFFPGLGGPVTFDQIAPGIADFDVQDGPLSGAQQTGLDEVLLEPAFGDEFSRGIEAVGFARLADPSQLGDAREILVGVDPERQGGDELAIGGPDRACNKHGGLVFGVFTKRVGQQDIGHHGQGDQGFAFDDPLQVIAVFRQDMAAAHQGVFR